MPTSWLNTMTPGDVIGALLALTFIGSAVFALTKLAPIVRKLYSVLDLIVGREPGANYPEDPGQPGMNAQFAEVRNRLDSVEAEMRDLKTALGYDPEIHK